MGSDTVTWLSVRWRKLLTSVAAEVDFTGGTAVADLLHSVHAAGDQATAEPAAQQTDDPAEDVGEGSRTFLYDCHHVQTAVSARHSDRLWPETSLHVHYIRHYGGTADYTQQGQGKAN